MTTGSPQLNPAPADDPGRVTVADWLRRSATYLRDQIHEESHRIDQLRNSLDSALARRAVQTAQLADVNTHLTDVLGADPVTLDGHGAQS